jgi:ribosome-binding protein aMBF1 (putative translation factor)
MHVVLFKNGSSASTREMAVKMLKRRKKGSTFQGYLDAKLKNKTFREAYEHYHDVLEIGLRIRELREAAGLTQKELAGSLGVSQQVIARLESGDANNPTVTTLERIAKATGHRLRFRFEPAPRNPSLRGRGASGARIKQLVKPADHSRIE